MDNKISFNTPFIFKLLFKRRLLCYPPPADSSQLFIVLLRTYRRSNPFLAQVETLQGGTRITWMGLYSGGSNKLP